jgi:hypothetical protein
MMTKITTIRTQIRVLNGSAMGNRSINVLAPHHITPRMIRVKIIPMSVPIMTTILVPFLNYSVSVILLPLIRESGGEFVGVFFLPELGRCPL